MKYFKVTQCLNCPNFNDSFKMCGVYDKKIENIRQIPKWCPLDNELSGNSGRLNKQAIVNLVSQRRKLIESIKVDKANFEHIAKTGNINGTLLIEIDRVMDEYANHKTN